MKNVWNGVRHNGVSSAQGLHLSHAPTFNVKTSVIRYESYLQQKFGTSAAPLAVSKDSHTSLHRAQPKAPLPLEHCRQGFVPALASDANAGAKLHIFSEKPNKD